MNHFMKTFYLLPLAHRSVILQMCRLGVFSDLALDARSEMRNDGQYASILDRLVDNALTMIGSHPNLTVC